MPFSVVLGGICFCDREKIIEIIFGYTDNRLYIWLMKRSTRKPRAYKIDDVYYEAAQKKAAATDKPLAVRIEEFVKRYAGVEKTAYFASMGNTLMQESNKKKK